MFKRILLGTDFSPASDRLVRCVGQLKRLGTEEVILAHIIYSAVTIDLDKLEAGEAAPKLAREKGILERAGLRVQTEMFLGKPAYSLESLAEKHDVSLVVVGSHGHGLAASLILGSVPDKLLQLSRRPLLLVRTQRADEAELLECDRLFSHLLFATDFSEASEAAFGGLRRLASSSGSPVTLLHVRGAGTKNLEQAREIDRDRLERMKLSLEASGVARVGVDQRQGREAEEIVAGAREHGCSLIVMGTHGKGLLGGALLGSVAHEVARRAGTPVLYLPTAWRVRG